MKAGRQKSGFRRRFFVPSHSGRLTNWYSGYDSSFSATSFMHSFNHTMSNITKTMGATVSSSSGSGGSGFSNGSSSGGGGGGGGGGSW